MKSKVIKGIAVYILTIALVFSGVLCLGGAFEASASSIYDENYNLNQQAAAALTEEMNYYGRLDTTPDKSISQRVNLKIGEYSKQLIDLQTDPQVNTHSLEGKITLARAKGIAVGRLAWIYNANISEVSNSISIAAVNEKYAELCDRIAGGTLSTVETVGLNEICTEMNRCVFGERIKELAKADDSLDASAVIAGALARLEYINDAELDGGAFADALAEAESALLLQRGRDFLTQSMKEIFAVVCPNENYNTNSKIALFTYNIEDATSLAQMNAHLAQTLSALISVPSGENNAYLRLFAAQLSELVSQEARRADSQGKAVDALPLFANYAFEKYRADTKDKIYALVFADAKQDEALERIEARYNGKDGIVERAADVLTLTCEVQRAKYEAELCRKMLECKASMEIILGAYQNTALYERVQNVYTEADTQIISLAANEAIFEDKCKEIVKNAAEQLEALINEARVERFLGEHKAVIQKPKDELTLSDEIFLRCALSDYIALPQTVQALLDVQIKKIVEKYNTVISMKMRELYYDDAYYLKLCEKIEAKLTEISTLKTDEYYNKADMLLKEAELLRDVIRYYRAITETALYSSYTQQNKKELSDVCDQSTDVLVKISLDDIDGFADALNELLRLTRLDMDRINECVRVESATRGSENTSILAIVHEAKGKIKLCDDRNKMLSIASNAIFEINKILTNETASLRAEEAKYKISQMSFLPEADKKRLSERLDSLKLQTLSDISDATGETMLGFVWTSFSEILVEISREAELKDVSGAKQAYTSELEGQLDMHQKKLAAMLYITENKRDEYYNKYIQIKTAFLDELASASSTDRVAAAYRSALVKLEITQGEAVDSDVLEYKKAVVQKLDLLLSFEGNYSDENYNSLKNVIEKAKQSLAACRSIEDCNALLERTNSEADSIDDLLDEAKHAGLTQVNEFLAQCMALPNLYSSENMTEVKKLHAEFLLKLESYGNISDIGEVNSLSGSTLEAMQKIRRRLLYSSADAVEVFGEAPKYPDGYDISAGLWGCIYAPDGISSSATFRVDAFSGDELLELQRLIRRYARGDKLTSVSQIDAAKLKLLRKCVVSLGVDMKLSEMCDGVNKYSIRLLLPPELRGENVLGIVFVDGDNVEYYDVNNSDGLISFELSHFSKYYIVTESTTNMMPLIVFLSVMLVIEFAALGLILYLRYSRKKKENGVTPVLSIVGFAPALTNMALKVEPQNGVGIVILLSFAVVAAGCAVAFLARMELKEYKKRIDKPEARGEHNTRRELARAKTTPLLSAAENYLAESVNEKEELEENEENEENEELLERVLCTVGASAQMPEEEHLDSLNESTSRRSRHKAQVNLDVIARNFPEGAVVNLELLKEKGLVAENVNYVKILARGSLDKPLVVEANDFSHAAQIILKATGGEAVKVKF